MIGQAQMINVVGRIGGEGGSESMAAFSDGMGWTNLDGIMPSFARKSSQRRGALRFHVGSAARRAKASKSDTQLTKNDAEVIDQEDMKAPGSKECSFATISPPVEKLTLCVFLLVLIFCIRAGLVLIVERCFKKEAPTAMLFPLWEGPVFFVQYLAICDAVFTAIYTYCPVGISIGALVLFFGPLLMLSIILVRLRPFLDGDGAMLYEEKPPPPSFPATIKLLWNTKGLAPRWAIVRDWKDRSQHRGEWDDSNKRIRYWSWCVHAYTRARTHVTTVFG